MSDNSGSSKPCADCGSTDIVLGVRVRTGDSSRVGLAYGGFFGGTEPLLADVCNVCGTVVRFRVAQPRDNWRAEQNR